MSVGIIFEGGTFRPIFSAGIMDAFLDNGVRIPYVIGISAGATNAASYVSGQRGRNLDVLVGLRHDKRYVSINNYIKERSLFGLDFSFNEVPNRLYPMDFDAIRNFDGEYIVGVTNALTGKAEYKNGKNIDRECTILRATCAIPVVFPTIDIDGIPYYDGGIADSIPVQKSIDDGNDKNIIVLTRPAGYKKELTLGVKLVAAKIRKEYPATAQALLRRHIVYNEQVALAEKLERDGKALILRPEMTLNSFENDIERIKNNYRHGYDMAVKRMDEIKEFISK